MNKAKSLLALLSTLYLILFPQVLMATEWVDYAGPEGEVVMGPRCGTHEPSLEELEDNARQVEAFLNSGDFTTSRTMVNIPVAVHVVMHDNGYGNVTDTAIAHQLDVLNLAYNEWGYSFTLASTDRTYNTTWSTHSANTGAEIQMKQALAIDPATTLNLYFCNLGDNLLGYAFFPHYFPETSYRHGVVALWGTVPGGWASPYNEGDTVTHEVGHFLGLYHTFQGGCSGNGDFVSDTPPEATPAYGCPNGRDTCAGGGADPIHNFMNYVDDYCMYEFTAGQKARADQQMALYRPTMYAGTVNEINVEVTSAHGVNPVLIYSLPDGSGSPMTEAQESNCPDLPVIQDATIQVRLTDGSGNPIAGFAADKISVTAQSGGWVQCADNMLYADGPTNPNGEATISGALHAGGSSAADELMLVTVDDPDVASISYPQGLSGLQYWVNSPDFDASLEVDLEDVGPFAQDFFNEYRFASDFYWDCDIALSDVGRMAVGLGTSCPAEQQSPVLVGDGSLGLVFAEETGATSQTLPVGEQMEAYLVLQGVAAQAGVQAFAASVRASNNVIIHQQEILGRGVNLADDGSFTVGYAQARSGAGHVALARLRLSVTNDRPAHFWIEAGNQGSSKLPEVAISSGMVAVRPVSGAVTSPVAALNDKDFAGGLDPNQTANAMASLTMDVSPNPFNPMTNIKFTMVSEGQANVTIYDVRGKAVATLLDGFISAGERSLSWDASQQASGLYFCKVQTGNEVQIRKLTLLK